MAVSGWPVLLERGLHPLEYTTLPSRTDLLVFIFGVTVKQLVTIIMPLFIGIIDKELANRNPF